MTAASVVALAGCSFDQGSAGGGKDGKASEIKIAGWGGTQWTQNFNVFSPTATAVTPGTSFFYEPLLRLDRTKAGEVMPYLAKEWKFGPEGTGLTFTLRDDVTWNDGKKFTADDVVFTFDLVLSGKTNASWAFSKVEKVDDTHVKVLYDQPSFNDLVAFGSRAILPKHIWEKEDVAKFTNPKPVGTGPFVLDSFSPQQVALKLRDGYWGEKSKGVESVKILAMNPDAAKDALKKGEVDFGTMGWENGEEEFVKLDPENNEYSFYPVGTCDGIAFNCQQAPYNDPAVRRALRDCLDLQAAADAVKVGYEVPTVSGLDATVYKDMLAEAQEQSPQVDQAKAELAKAGWKVEGGKLVKDGKSYALRYDCYQPYTEWVLTGQLLAAQWKEKLGLDVQVNELADQPYSDIYEQGTYGMISTSPTAGRQISEVVTNFDSSKVGKPGENDGNDCFFKNARLDEIGKELVGIEPGTDDARVKALAVEAQNILKQEAPFIATATAGWKAVFNKKRWNNWPVKGETTFAPNNTLLADAALNLLSLEPK